MNGARPRSRLYIYGKQQWYAWVYGLELPWHRILIARVWAWLYRRHTGIRLR